MVLGESFGVDCRVREVKNLRISILSTVLQAQLGILQSDSEFEDILDDQGQFFKMRYATDIDREYF